MPTSSPASTAPSRCWPRCGCATAPGAGQWIDLSLFDTQLAVLANQATNYLIGGVVPRRMGNAHPNIVPYQVFEAADGPLVDRLRQRRPVRPALRGARARPAPRPALPHATATGSRTAPRWSRRSAARIAALPRAEVLAAMEAGGVPAGPINTVAEAFAEPQAVARGMVQEIGGSRSPRSPMRFSDAEIAAELPPPRLDEHGAGDPRRAGRAAPTGRKARGCPATSVRNARRHRPLADQRPRSRPTTRPTHR